MTDPALVRAPVGVSISGRYSTPNQVRDSSKTHSYLHIYTENVNIGRQTCWLDSLGAESDTLGLYVRHIMTTGLMNLQIKKLAKFVYKFHDS